MRRRVSRFRLFVVLSLALALIVAGPIASASALTTYNTSTGWVKVLTLGGIYCYTAANCWNDWMLYPYVWIDGDASAKTSSVMYVMGARNYMYWSPRAYTSWQGEHVTNWVYGGVYNGSKTYVSAHQEIWDYQANLPFRKYCCCSKGYFKLTSSSTPYYSSPWSACSVYLPK